MKSDKPFYSSPPAVKDLVTVEDVMEVATAAERQQYAKLAPEQIEPFLEAIAADYYKHSDAATKAWEHNQEAMLRSDEGLKPYEDRAVSIQQVEHDMADDIPPQRRRLAQLVQMSKANAAALEHRQEWLIPGSEEERRHDKEQAERWEQRPEWFKAYEAARLERTSGREEPDREWEKTMEQEASDFRRADPGHKDFPSAPKQLPLAAPDQRSREVYRDFLAQQQPVVTRSKKHGLEPGQSRGMGR